MSKSQAIFKALPITPRDGSFWMDAAPGIYRGPYKTKAEAKQYRTYLSRMDHVYYVKDRKVCRKEK